MTSIITITLLFWSAEPVDLVVKQVPEPCSFELVQSYREKVSGIENLKGFSIECREAEEKTVFIKGDWSR